MSVPAFFLGIGALQFGVFAGIIAFYLFFVGLKKLSIVNYSVLAYFEIIAASVFGIWFFEEKLGWNIALGSVLIISAGLTLSLKNHHNAQRN